MRQLFSHLVERIGSKDAIDPFTKKDIMWNLIDFFTRRGMPELTTSKNGENGYSSLDEKDIAKYFKNHINNSKTFERATQVVLRYNKDGNLF